MYYNLIVLISVIQFMNAVQLNEHLPEDKDEQNNNLKDAPLKKVNQFYGENFTQKSIKQDCSTASIYAIRLHQLRQIMIERNISAYIVTSMDDHQTEFVGPPDRRLEYITGFSGSMGDAVITLNKAAVWVDSRYHLQADHEVDCHWLLMRRGIEGIPSVQEWIGIELKSGERVSADPKIIPYDDWIQWKSYFSCYDYCHQTGSLHISLVLYTDNLIDKIWKDRPSYPMSPVVVHDLAFTGETWQDKLSKVRKMMKYYYASNCIISALDEIAWLLNLRGNDIPHTPVFRSYLIISEAVTTLYLPLEKITPLIQYHLSSSKDNVVVAPYERIWHDLSVIGKLSRRVLVPSSVGFSKGASYLIYQSIPKEKIYTAPSPIINLKAYKNDIEANGMLNAYIRDAVTICELWALLEKEVPAGIYWDELKVVSVLEGLRLKQRFNKGQSFQSIISFGSNTALPHYIPSLKTNKKVDKSGLLMIDSGGQYLDGTVDTTRVFSFGEPTEFQRQVYTALLQGCINLVTTTFPFGTTMQELDIIVRQPLYNLGLDYGHGSTHGIGVYLTVHEKPGYYKDGDFGMRLENIVQVIPAAKTVNTDNSFLTFQPVTLVPYEHKLINFKSLETKQLKWLNAYNKRIRKLVGNEMINQGKLQLFQWLINKTDPTRENDF